MPIIALVFLTLALLGGGAALAAENGPGTTNSPLQVAVSNALSTPPVFLANPIAAPASGATNPAGEPAGDVQPTATPITGTIQITMTATISDVKAIDGFRETHSISALTGSCASWTRPRWRSCEAGPSFPRVT